MAALSAFLSQGSGLLHDHFSRLTAHLAPPVHKALALLPEPLREPKHLIAAGTGAAVLYYGLRSLYRNARIWVALRHLPKPGGRLPLFGHALTLAGGTPWEIMETWAKDAGYQPVCLDVMLQTGIIISDPELVRHVFDRKHKNYVKDLDLSYSSFLDLLGHGIITSHGALWERQRKLLSVAFRMDILEDTAPVAKRAADRISHKIDAAIAAGTSIDMFEEFRVLTLQVISELILGMSPEESEAVFPALYLPIVEEANLRVWYPWRAYMPTPTNLHYHTTLRALNNFLQAFVVRRWDEYQARIRNPAASKEPRDILERVMAGMEPNDWGKEAAIYLRNEIKSFLLAGHETSASMLTWTVYELTQHADVAKRVIDEGQKVFTAARAVAAGQSDEYSVSPCPTTAELKHLTYTENCLKESLRKYTPVPVVSRICVEDDVMGGIFVPAHTKIFVNLKAIHWNPAIWPQPEQYRPDRFDTTFNIYHFNPFINGPRNCLGQYLALLESRLILSLLTQRFEFTPVSADAGRTHTYMVPVGPANGMHMTARRR